MKWLHKVTKWNAPFSLLQYKWLSLGKISFKSWTLSICQNRIWCPVIGNRLNSKGRNKLVMIYGNGIKEFMILSSVIISGHRYKIKKNNQILQDLHLRCYVVYFHSRVDSFFETINENEIKYILMSIYCRPYAKLIIWALCSLCELLSNRINKTIKVHKTRYKTTLEVYLVLSAEV